MTIICIKPETRVIQKTELYTFHCTCYLLPNIISNMKWKTLFMHFYKNKNNRSPSRLKVKVILQFMYICIKTRFCITHLSRLDFWYGTLDTFREIYKKPDLYAWHLSVCTSMMGTLVFNGWHNPLLLLSHNCKKVQY